MMVRACRRGLAFGAAVVLSESEHDVTQVGLVVFPER